MGWLLLILSGFVMVCVFSLVMYTLALAEEFDEEECQEIEDDEDNDE